MVLLKLAGKPLFFTQQAQQQMLCSKIVMAKRLRFLYGQLKVLFVRTINVYRDCIVLRVDERDARVPNNLEDVIP